MRGEGKKVRRKMEKKVSRMENRSGGGGCSGGCEDVKRGAMKDVGNVGWR